MVIEFLFNWSYPIPPGYYNLVGIHCAGIDHNGFFVRRYYHHNRLATRHEHRRRETTKKKKWLNILSDRLHHQHQNHTYHHHHHYHRHNDNHQLFPILREHLVGFFAGTSALPFSDALGPFIDIYWTQSPSSYSPSSPSSSLSSSSPPSPSSSSSSSSPSSSLSS